MCRHRNPHYHSKVPSSRPRKLSGCGASPYRCAGRQKVAASRRGPTPHALLWEHQGHASRTTLWENKHERNRSRALFARRCTSGATGCKVQVDKSSNGEGDNVKIATPFGGISVNKDQTSPAELGLPAYPGSVLDTGRRRKPVGQSRPGVWLLEVAGEDGQLLHCRQPGPGTQFLPQGAERIRRRDRVRG